MDRIKRMFTRLGFDGWAFLLCGVGSVVIAVLDFAQVVHLTNEDALRMVIVAVGLMMSTIATQSGRRTAELEALRDALGVTSIELVNSSSDRRQQATHARNFYLDTTLQSQQHATLTHPLDHPNNVNYVLYERLKRGEISYRKIEAITNKERLEYVVSRLLIFEGMDFLVRYYDAPPKPIPVLNMASIDNEVFYLGSFYVGDPPTETVREAVIRSADMRPLFEAYWSNLWHLATPLNEGKRIDWDELRSIAHRVGMGEEEFKSVVSKWKTEVKSRKEP